MKKLSIENIKEIDQKIQLSENKIILRVDVAGKRRIYDDDYHYNIYCIDKDYHIIWQVKTEPTPFFDRGDGFTYIKKSDKGEILANRYGGYEYKIDPATGEGKYIGQHR